MGRIERLKVWTIYMVFVRPLLKKYNHESMKQLGIRRSQKMANFMGAVTWADANPKIVSSLQGYVDGMKYGYDQD